MTPDTLARYGALLFGPQWQTPLADRLGVSARTMRRWAAGTHAAPAGLADDLRRLLADRHCQIGLAIKEAAPTPEAPQDGRS